MRRSPPSRRLILLMPLAAWSVHQLRYVAAYGSGVGRELSHDGHSYLTLLMPAIVALAALALGGFLVRFARSWRDGTAGRSRPHDYRGLWALTVAGLIAIYVGQESIEGLLATGHPAGLGGILGDGGWWAIPAAAVVGTLVALGLRGARAIEGLLADRRPSAERRTRRPRIRMPSSAAVPLPAPLARMGAGRAPPVAPSPA